MSPSLRARVAVLSLAVVSLASVARAEAPVIWKPRVGEPFPDLRLPTLDGRAASVSDYRGRKLLLHVFASW